MKIFSINAGHFKLDGGAMHGVVPKSMWQKANPCDENNMCSWAMRCLLIDIGDRKILVDTGMGDKQDAKFFGHFQPHGEDSIEKNLQKNGYKTSDITDVFLTHLHFDHCGGAVKKVGDQLKPTFENAVYWSNEQHWQSALEPNEREKASFLKENFVPLAVENGRLKYIAPNTKNWLPNIDLIFVNGHTDAMMLPLITFKGRKILFCADLIPSVAHISMPWVMAYDMRPLDTLNEKRVILKQALEENWVLYMEHDPKIECATLTAVDGRIKLNETFDLNSL